MHGALNTPTTKTISSHPVFKAALKAVPWLITVVALYAAFHDVDWSILIDHVGEAHPSLLVLALGLTCASYVMRSRRWQFLFPERVINLAFATRVLILGFFMNNILPARAGEFVRAHMGAKVTRTTRTLVLATVASERLADGLMLSIMFVAFSFGIGNKHLSQNLFLVASFFAGVSIAVVALLLFREKIFRIVECLNKKVDHRASHYAYDRFKIFINGLSPLCNPSRITILSLWTLAIWLTELSVYIAISLAYDGSLSLPACILFLVTVNFSSLIPAAPGGIGVIEAIASTVLISVGVPKEKALTMVITQHVIQYLVVGIPGSAIMVTWKNQLRQLKEAAGKDE